MSITEIVEELLGTIVRDYDVGPVIGHSLIESDLSIIERELPRGGDEKDPASVNEVGQTIRLDTSNGSYCLKTYRSGNSASHISLEECLISFLQEVGYTLAPNMIPTREAEFHVEAGGSRWWLSRYIEADAPYSWMIPTWRNHACYVAGKALGALHHTTDGLNIEVVRQWANFGDDGLKEESDLESMSRTEELVYLSALATMEAVLDETVRRCGKALEEERFKGDPLLSFIIENPRALKETLLGALSFIEDQKRTLGTLELLVHGDFHPGNLLFRENPEDKQLVAVLDYEHVHLEDPVFDVAYAAAMFSAAWGPEVSDYASGQANFVKSFNKGSQAFLDPRLLRSLLMGYFEMLESGLRQGGVLKIGRLNKFALMHRVATLIGPYLEISCFLIFFWQIEKYLSSSERMRPVFMRGAVHVLNLLFHVTREAKTKRDWLKDLPRK